MPGSCRASASCPQLPTAARRSPWDLIALDRRATSVDELLLGSLRPRDRDRRGRCRKGHGPVRGGHPPAPSQRRGWRANRSGIGLLELPRSRRKPPREFRRILVSFGGEDIAGLSLGLARFLVSEGFAIPPTSPGVRRAEARRAAPGARRRHHTGTRAGPQGAPLPLRSRVHAVRPHRLRGRMGALRRRPPQSRQLPSRALLAADSRKSG